MSSGSFSLTSARKEAGQLEVPAVKEQADDKSDNFKRNAIIITTMAIIVFGVTAGVLGWHYGKPESVVMEVTTPAPTTAPPGEILKVGELSFDTESNMLTLESKSQVKLKAELGIDLGVGIRCSESAENVLCVNWEYKKVTLSITHDADNSRYKFAWESTGGTGRLEDCYDLTYGYWYGGAQMFRQRWPINDMRQRLRPFVTRDVYRQDFGNVQERYWLSSNAFALFFEADVPLWVSMNIGGQSRICYVAFEDDYPYNQFNYDTLRLSYTFFTGNNIKDTHLSVADQMLSKPTDIPDTSMFTYPIWSTWAMYKKTINEELVLEYADLIKQYDFPYSHIEIDDEWSTEYGDFEFDPVKFPDPPGLMNKLNDEGFKVTLWIHTFANLASEEFLVGVENDRWVTDSGGDVTALTNWWNGQGAVLDTTNQKAVESFVDKLIRFRDENGFDSYKFDAGETNWLPKTFRLNASFPDEFTIKYVEAVSQLGKMIEVRAGTRTQHLPIFTRIMDKGSTWGYVNGLKTVIPCALTFGLLGYPFVLPDMIGGNAYSILDGLEGDRYPSKELFERWTQVNAFLPSMQFSVAPWLEEYDDTTIAIAKNMVELHIENAPLIIDLARNATITGMPIIRPMWWVAPTDEATYTIDDQFLLGDDIIVAPILDRSPLIGRSERDIYLPAGIWEDKLSGENHTGPKTLKDYWVKREELAYFVRIS